MYGGDRGQLREVFFRAWRKHRDGAALEGIERLIVDIAIKHPEYQRVLEHPDEYGERDYLPGTGQTNPFLHLGMHVSIEEQLALDQPAGSRALYHALALKLGDAHAAQHAMMDCLGDMLWQAQQARAAPDFALYLECLRRRAGMPAP